MHGNEVFQRVRHALAQVEAERNVRVLFACESGSRAWGFASRDSDYDVRFLYVHRRDWYLSVEDRRDVIEQPIADDLDVSGWELRKALRLLRKSNPPLLEWLKSPVVYRHDPVFAAEFGALATEFYSPRRCFAHYLHMAFGNWRDYLRGREEVSLKKYLYVFRPLLACRWIERQLGQVPMLFAQLVEGVLDEADVRAALAELVARKQAGEELAVAPPVEALTRFIEAELPRLEALNEPDDAAGDVDELNGFFRRYALAACEEETTAPSVPAIRQHRRGRALTLLATWETLAKEEAMTKPDWFLLIEQWTVKRMGETGVTLPFVIGALAHKAAKRQLQRQDIWNVLNEITQHPTEGYFTVVVWCPHVNAPVFNVMSTKSRYKFPAQILRPSGKEPALVFGSNLASRWNCFDAAALLSQVAEDAAEPVVNGKFSRNRKRENPMEFEYGDFLPRELDYIRSTIMTE